MSRCPECKSGRLALAPQNLFSEGPVVVKCVQCGHIHELKDRVSDDEVQELNQLFNGGEKNGRKQG